MSTIASAVAASDGSTPKEPVRRTRTRSPSALTSVTIRPEPVGDLVEGDVLLGRLAQRLVHDRDGAHPADGLLERRLGVRRVDPAGLQPQQRGHGLQVVLHPVVDLADGGVLGDQLAVAAAQVGHVAQQHQRPEPLAGRCAAGSPARSAPRRRCRPRCRGGARPSSTALSVSSSVRCSGGTSSRVTRGQLEAGEVAGVAEPAVHREGVGARVGDQALGVDAQEPVAHPRGVGVVAALAGVREVAARRSSGSGRRPSGGRTAPAGWGCARPAGWCCARPRAMTRSRAPYGDRLDPHRHVVAPLGVALADQPAAARTPRPAAVAARSARRCPTHVVDERRRAGRGAHLARRPEALPLAVGQPQHQVGERQVGDDLPVRHQQLQPAARPRRRGRCGCAPGR